MDDSNSEADAVIQHTCRDLLGIDCTLPLNHPGAHVSRHKRDLMQRKPASVTKTVDVLTGADRTRTWRDRYGWRVWWNDDANRWVSQADSGTGSDKPRSVEDLRERGPYTIAA